MPKKLIWVQLDPEFTGLQYTVTIDKLSEYFEKVTDDVFKIKDNVYLKVTRNEIQLYACDNNYPCD